LVQAAPVDSNLNEIEHAINGDEKLIIIDSFFDN